MPAIVLKDGPASLHRRLKQQAAAQRRSLQQEAMLAIERGLVDPAGASRLPTPVKTRIPLTEEWLRMAKSEGRA